MWLGIEGKLRAERRKTFRGPKRLATLAANCLNSCSNTTYKLVQWNYTNSACVAVWAAAFGRPGCHFQQAQTPPTSTYQAGRMYLSESTVHAQYVRLAHHSAHRRSTCKSQDPGVRQPEARRQQPESRMRKYIGQQCRRICRLCQTYPPRLAPRRRVFVRYLRNSAAIAAERGDLFGLSTALYRSWKSCPPAQSSTKPVAWLTVR